MNTVAKTLGLDTFGKHVEDVTIGEIFRLRKFWNKKISWAYIIPLVKWFYVT